MAKQLLGKEVTAAIKRAYQRKCGSSSGKRR